MARRAREDGPGVWHHVFNRGLSRRTVFESGGIVRFFLSRIGLAIRRGEIELHAFVFMTTHFHMLVRSVTGELSVALKRIESEFVRWFNHLRGRDGALFRGRFGSKPVKSMDYRRLLVRYIDQNPVVAGLVPLAESYPYGSARAFLTGQVPPWLSRWWIDEDLRYWTDRGLEWNSAYRLAYSDRPLSRDELFVAERRMVSAASPRDDSADLMRFASANFNADGTKPGWPVVGPFCIADAVATARDADPGWSLGGVRACVWKLAEAGLLRSLGGMKFIEIGQRLGRSTSAAKRLHDRHVELLSSDTSYALRFAELARCALDCNRKN